MSVVINLSGGMDSATLLGYYRERKESCLCLNFYYGSKHGIREGLASEKVANHYGCKLLKINVENVFEHIESNLLLSGGSIPNGHYEDESMKKTVVPGRNTILVAIAAGIAESRGYEKLSLAIHQGDHHIYPDCRPEWLGHIARSISASTEGTVRVETPFLEWNKTEICKLGLLIKVPYSLTYTCYKGNQKSCGKCGSCTERLEAFKTNKVSDPLTYEV